MTMNHTGYAPDVIELEVTLGAFATDALQGRYDAVNEWARSVPIDMRAGVPVVRLPALARPESGDIGAELRAKGYADVPREQLPTKLRPLLRPSDKSSLADRIERVIDPEGCNYGPPTMPDGVPGIIVNLKASEWRQVIAALRGSIPSAGVRSESGETFLGENDYREALLHFLGLRAAAPGFVHDFSLACGIADAMLDGKKSASAPIDGYAVVTSDGAYVGIWRERDLAEKIVNRSPSAKGETIVPMRRAEAPDG